MGREMPPIWRDGGSDDPSPGGTRIGHSVFGPLAPYGCGWLNREVRYG